MKNAYLNKEELALFNKMKPIFNQDQLNFINRRTPPSEIEEKVDDKGEKYRTVSAQYVKKVVTIVTGGNYNFEIKNQEYYHVQKEVVTVARLTIYCDGRVFFREQCGKHRLESMGNNGRNGHQSNAKDIANGFKASASDAFKKCASEFGFICWDAYTREASEGKESDVKSEMTHSEKVEFDRFDSSWGKITVVKDLEDSFEYLESERKEVSTALKELFDKHMNRILES